MHNANERERIILCVDTVSVCGVMMMAFQGDWCVKKRSSTDGRLKLVVEARKAARPGDSTRHLWNKQISSDSVVAVGTVLDGHHLSRLIDKRTKSVVISRSMSRYRDITRVTLMAVARARKPETDTIDDDFDADNATDTKPKREKRHGRKRAT
jgi:hypothetical protein